MDHHPSLGKESVLIQSSLGANKDPRYFYSTCYSSEYNRDLLKKLPAIDPSLKHQFPVNSYFRKRQETGFVENELPSIPSEWIEDPFKKDRYISTYKLDCVNSKNASTKQISGTLANGIVTNSGYTTSNRPTVYDTSVDLKADRYEAKLDKRLGILQCNTKKTEEINQHIFSPTGELIPISNISIASMNPDTPYVIDFESDKQQKDVYGHLKPGQSHSYETYQIATNSKIGKKSELPASFNVTSVASTAFTKISENNTILKHKSVNNKVLNDRQERHLMKVNPVELLSFKSKRRISSVNHETYLPILKDQIRHDPKKYSVGPREISGAVRDFHGTDVTYAKLNMGITETQSQYLNWQPNAEFSVFAKRGNLKSNISESGYTETNTNQPTYPVHHHLANIKIHPMLARAHRIYGKPLQKISV